MFTYRYELRRASEVVATGHLAQEEPFELGDTVSIGGYAGVVRRVEPALGTRELRLVVELSAEPQR